MKKYQEKYIALFIGVLICIFISDGFAVILQFVKGDVLDYAVSGEMRSTLKYSLLLIGLILLEILFHFVYKRLSAGYIVGCTKSLKHDIFESILRRGYVDFKKHPLGEYISKYTNEADTIKTRLFSMQTLFFGILFKILFVSAALFLLDWRIATVTLFLLTTPLYVPKLVEKRLQKVQAEYLRAAEESLSKINDWLAGFEAIKNFSIEQKVMERFVKVNENVMEKLYYDMRLGAFAQLITTLISYLSYFLVLICAAWLVVIGDFTAGQFFIAIGMIDQLSYPLISLADIIRQLVAIKPACASMEMFLSYKGSKLAKYKLKNIKRDIRLHNVSFAYDGQLPIIQNLSFVIEKGKRYLLKGPSGCGKTTIINLLLRYYDVASGKIEIDGVPIKIAGSTYSCITVVRQEAILFHDTLRNNLAMYNTCNTHNAIPDDRIICILDMLGLEKFACLDALNSVIMENGANLSGGEKKRLCLARALLRDTDVLILDEPLANLDYNTACRIEDLLLSITGQTLLVVSHQFSEEKIGKFDQVLDLEKK